MRRWAIAAAVLVGGGTGCGYDSSGLGSASGATPNSGGGDTDEATDTTSTSGMSGIEDADGSGDPDEGSTGSVDGGPGSTGPGGSTGTTDAPPDECDDPPPFAVEIHASQALLQPPMVEDSNSEEGSYAYSEVAEQGRASFEFTVPCRDDYWVFARVHDPGVGLSGLDSGQPDSYYVAFDGDADQTWLYGCQTFDEQVGGWLWSWLPVVTHTGGCVQTDFQKTLNVGTHFVHFGNREAGDHQPVAGDYIGNVAAIARVVVTNDPAWSP